MQECKQWQAGTSAVDLWLLGKYLALQLWICGYLASRHFSCGFVATWQADISAVDLWLLGKLTLQLCCGYTWQADTSAVDLWLLGKLTFQLSMCGYLAS